MSKIEPGCLVNVSPPRSGSPDGYSGIFTVVGAHAVDHSFDLVRGARLLAAWATDGVEPDDYEVNLTRSRLAYTGKCCVSCRQVIPPAEVALPAGAAEKCPGCVDDGTQIEADDVPPCAASMGCLCAGHARGDAADAPCDTNEMPYCDKCPKRARQRAVAVTECCGRFYARCEAHGGWKGAKASRTAHRGLTGCQQSKGTV